MPRKAQGWITFQSSEEERQILEQICKQTQRTKTEVLREMLRSMGRSPSQPSPISEFSADPPAADAADEETDLEDADDGDDARTEEPLPLMRTATLQAVKISARNILTAKVKRVIRGKVNAEVTLAIAPGVEIVSVITRSSADSLGLKKGKSVFAVIKSTNVMIAEA